MNEVSKPRLSLLVLVKLCKSLLSSKLYALRTRNGQKGFAGLVDMQGQGSSDKDCLNILRDEDLRKRDEPSIGSGDRRAEILRQEIRA